MCIALCSQVAFKQYYDNSNAIMRNKNTAVGYNENFKDDDVIEGIETDIKGKVRSLGLCRAFFMEHINGSSS